MILCSPQLGISPESGLGGEVYDREILKALADLGVEIHIILPLGKKYTPHKNFHIYFLPTPFVWPPYLFNLLILPYLFWIYWRHHFEVLRVHSPYFVGPAVILFKLFCPKVKTVASYLHLETNNSLYNLIDKNLIKHFSLITTISEATKMELIKRYNIKPVVIPCGVDPKYKLMPKNFRLVEKYGLKNKKVLLYLGQLIERKNIPFLFKLINKLPSNYILMICGDGSLRQKLENEAPDKVIFTGKILEEEKVDYYNLADVFVYPSLKEGFGLSVAEAIACGKPVVASNVPIVENTLLDTKKWREAILKEKPYNHLLKFSWKESAINYVKLISK